MGEEGEEGDTADAVEKGELTPVKWLIKVQWSPVWGAREPWFNQPAPDSGYHQMGKSTAPAQPDVAAAQHMSSLGPDTASGPAPVPYPDEAGTLSMFYKDDVENEETLAGERSQAVNGGSGSAPHPIHQQANSGQGDDQPPLLPGHSPPQYINDGNYSSQGYTQKPGDTQDHHAENLEYVPNQEVLPSETHLNPAAASVEQFETGPNLETPDSISRPMRSASVSSNYSNISHGSGTAARRHQGVAGTFIQQESPRLSDEASLSPATGRYFEQIDTSPAGVSCPQQSSLEQMWPSTPSPPKPTGNFQTSANSSFEPVRSHGVGVRPPEVDKAKMEAEGRADSAPGNLEQPPDNIENIYSSGHPLPVSSGTALLTNPVVHSHSRPSSRAFGATQPCESPATTLWAQNDPTSLSTNILLAPAAPTILAPLREPSTDVIQPPEDGPLDLQPLQRAQQMSQQHSENLENPPKVSEADPTDSQGHLGYASLLVSESLQQPVLIAPPVSTYSVTPSSTSAQISGQISKREATPPVRTLTQGQAASASQSASVTSSQSPLVAPGPISFTSVASKQGPLNLTRNSMEAKSDLAALPQTQPGHPPLARGQTLGGDAHSAVHVNSQASLLTAPVTNQNQQSNYELLDFSMHQSQAQSQAPGPPPCLHESPQSTNGFYLQVTKDAQQGIKVAESLSAISSIPQTPSACQPARTTQPQAEPPKVPEPYAAQGQNIPPPVEVSGSQAPQSQYPVPAPGPSPGSSALPWPASGNSSVPGPADGPYRSRADGWYGRYEGHLAAYHDQSYQYREPQPERPSSRSSQYSDRPSSRKEGYDDQWRYYPGYDSSFDDDYRRRGESYNDDFDRRSVHSEQSAHSVHSSRSHHSRRSSFSSRSQQSQVYRSQPDLVSAVYDTTSSTLAVDYSYAQYPAQNDVSQNYYGYPSEYTTDSTWTAPEQPPPRPATPEKFTMPHCCARFGPGGHLVQVLPNLPSAGQPALVDIHSMETVVGTDIADLLLKEHRSVWLPGKSPKEANLIDFNNEPLARAEEEPGAGPLSLLSDTFMTVPENVGKETERFRELLLFGRKKDALEAAMKAGLWGHALLLASKMDNRTHARVMTRFANSLPINDPLQTVYQLMSGRMPASATCCGEEKWGDWRPHLAMVLSNLTHTLDLDTRTITTMGDTLASKGLLDAAHFCYLMAQVGLGVFTKKSTKMVLIGSNHSLPFFQFATNEAIQRTEAYEYAQSLGSHPCSLPNFQVFKFIYACRLAEAGLSAQAFHYCEVVSRTVLMHPGYYAPFFISQIIQMSEKLRFFDPQLKEKPEQELFNEPEWLIELRRLDGQIRTGVIQYNEDRATPTQFGSSSPSSDLDEQSPPEPNAIPTEFDGPTPDNPLMSSLLPGPPPQGVQLMPPAPTSILQNGMTISQPDVPQFYPVPPSGPPGHVPISGYPPQDPGFAPPPFQPQPEHSEMYPGSQQQCPPSYHVGQVPPPHIPPQVPHSPVEMHHTTPQIFQHMPPSPGHIPSVDQLAQTPLEISSSPRRSSFTQQKDLYDQMAHMVRSWEEVKDYVTIFRLFGGGGWLKNWFWKGKNEAHLPDDKNKSIVWDEQKQKWVDLNEPEEESKPPPPPPTGFPAMTQKPGPAGPGAPPSSGPPVNMFSRKAGTRQKYVDVLNPSKPANSGLAPNPADIFAPLAPMSMPANLFVPSSGAN
ncbi:unnamed protein product, partial [Tetraodon nigroviridis]